MSKVDPMTRLNVVAAALLAAGIAVAPATTALAAGTTTCDAYSHKCTTVEGKKIAKPPTSVLPQQDQLPFTGAEILGMSAAGAAALGGGVVLVVAGRRRRRAAA
jgi:hypothetical protein